jgi:hypothetical protein
MNGSLTSVKTIQIQKRSIYNITASVNENILEIVVKGDIPASDTYEIIMTETIDVEESANIRKQLLDLRMRIQGERGDTARAGFVFIKISLREVEQRNILAS